MSEHQTISVTLVAAGQFHDIDYSRLELLNLFSEHPQMRVRVTQDYHNTEAIMASDMLVTYTCNLVPEQAEQEALRDYVAGGGKWLALHGTNSILEFLDDGRVNAPETAPVFMETLGTQFLAHPPIQPFKVTVADPQHPLVAGVPEFETDDELYLCRQHGQLHTLLETRFVGEATGFVLADWPDDVSHPVYYINKVGNGEVLYLNLGHCRGHYDMEPVLDYFSDVQRGAWEKPEFVELLRRGLRWIRDDTTEQR